MSVAKESKKPSGARSKNHSGDVVQIPSATQIKAIREARNLTQTEAAKLVGVGQGVWAAWERGLRKPSRQSAILIHLLANKKI